MILHTKKDESIQEDRIDITYRQLNSNIENIISFIRGKHAKLDGILENKRYQLNITDIFYFDTVDKKNFAYTETAVYQIEYNLTTLEDLLNDYGFIRINKSNIINAHKIDFIKSDFNMKINAHLTSGEVLVISRHYKKCFEESLCNIKNSLLGGSFYA